MTFGGRDYTHSILLQKNMIRRDILGLTKLLGVDDRVYKYLYPESKFIDDCLVSFREMIRSYEYNREKWSEVDTWVTDKAIDESKFRYGIPFDISNLSQPTSFCTTDIITYINNKYYRSVNYLEIGVSIGKTFYPQIKNENINVATGIDIERFNPCLKKYVDVRHFKEGMYTDDKGSVFFKQGDVTDNDTWRALSGINYDVIFSDALHDPDAIKKEYKYILNNNILSNDFVYIWDDITNPSMLRSVFSIIEDMKNSVGLSLDSIYHGRVCGTYGVTGEPHSIIIVDKDDTITEK